MTEMESLKAKLAASEGRPGYEQRVEAIKARIAELETEELAEEEDGSSD